MDCNPRLRHLKIKIKALAAEAGIIRHEERKTREMERWELSRHRRTTVREEARHSLLAYAFWRGRPYAEVEASGTANPPDWDRVEKIAARFGRITANPAAWIAWRQAAEAHLKQVRPAA